jgi:hypothetical protein
MNSIIDAVVKATVNVELGNEQLVQGLAVLGRKIISNSFLNIFSPTEKLRLLPLTLDFLFCCFCAF